MSKYGFKPHYPRAGQDEDVIERPRRARVREIQEHEQRDVERALRNKDYESLLREDNELA